MLPHPAKSRFWNHEINYIFLPKYSIISLTTLLSLQESNDINEILQSLNLFFHTIILLFSSLSLNSPVAHYVSYPIISFHATLTLNKFKELCFSL